MNKNCKRTEMRSTKITLNWKINLKLKLTKYIKNNDNKKDKNTQQNE